MGQLPRFLAWLGLSAGVVALDLWTKALASAHLELYRPEPVWSWFNLTLAHNRGAAFSFLATQGGWQRWFFIIVSVVIIAILLVWLWRLCGQMLRRFPLAALAIALVMGGAIGNLVDRIRLGYVVDFLDLHYAGWHWPAFNIADAAITVGIILLLLDSFLTPAESNSKANTETADQRADQADGN